MLKENYYYLWIKMTDIDEDGKIGSKNINF